MIFQFIVIVITIVIANHAYAQDGDDPPRQYVVAFRTAQGLESFLGLDQYKEITKKVIPKSFSAVFQWIDSDEEMEEIVETLEDVKYWEKGTSTLLHTSIALFCLLFDES